MLALLLALHERVELTEAVQERQNQALQVGCPLSCPLMPLSLHCAQLGFKRMTLNSLLDGLGKIR